MVNNLIVRAKSPHVGYRVKLVTMSAISPVKALMNLSITQIRLRPAIFCYSQQHIVSSNPHINDVHFWKEQDSHTSRNEHCMTPKQALLAPSLH